MNAVDLHAKSEASMLHATGCSAAGKFTVAEALRGLARVVISNQQCSVQIVISYVRGTYILAYFHTREYININLKKGLLLRS